MDVQQYHWETTLVSKFMFEKPLGERILLDKTHTLIDVQTLMLLLGKLLHTTPNLLQRTPHLTNLA